MPFSKTHLQHVLRNITYTGKLRYAGKIYQGLHQPLISDDLFNHVQTLFHEKQQKRSVYKNRLLAGLVRCAECDSIMTLTHTNKKPRQRYHYYRCTKTYRQDWNACATQQVSADRLEQLIIENLKRVSLDNNYIDSLIFKLNFDGSRAHQGLEPSQSRSEIDPKIVQKNLKDIVDYLEKASKIEQALAMKRYIKNILYSKESIQINMFCHPQVIDRQNIKNPDPLLNRAVCGRAAAAASRESLLSRQTKMATADSSHSLNLAVRTGRQTNFIPRLRSG